MGAVLTSGVLISWFCFCYDFTSTATHSVGGPLLPILQMKKLRAWGASEILLPGNVIGLAQIKSYKNLKQRKEKRREGKGREGGRKKTESKRGDWPQTAVAELGPGPKPV